MAIAAETSDAVEPFTDVQGVLAVGMCGGSVCADAPMRLWRNAQPWQATRPLSALWERIWREPQQGDQHDTPLPG